MKNKNEDKIYKKYFFRTFVSLGALFGAIAFFQNLGQVLFFDYVLLTILAFITIQSAFRLVGLFRPKWEKQENDKKQRRNS